MNDPLARLLATPPEAIEADTLDHWTPEQLEAFAAEHGAVVEYETLGQDMEGRWQWRSGLGAGTVWVTGRPSPVRWRARIVTPWVRTDGPNGTDR